MRCVVCVVYEGARQGQVLSVVSFQASSSGLASRQPKAARIGGT